MNSEIFLIDVKEGAGGIHISDIGAILPDTTAPQTRSVLYTGLFPNGISVEGDSETLIGMWLLHTQAPEPEGEYCDMCGETPCVCEVEVDDES